jgi:sugar lactone lactonase YvrE
MPDTQAIAIERVGGDLRCTVGESPAWCAGEHAWYWVDIPAKKIWRLDASSGALRSWSTPEMTACIALKRDGGLVAGMETGIFSLSLGDGDTADAQQLAMPPPDELTPGMRFNDGRCDRQGRFWAGTMFRDMAAARPDGRLYRYDAQGLSKPMVSELVTQNGIAFSPDGRTMYLSDSHPTRRRVWAFDYDIDEGFPHDRRLFVDMADCAGRPDGATVDTDGCYWVAGNDGGCLMRYTPQGLLDRTIALPMAKPSMCCFGGASLDTMLVTSIDPGPGAGQGGGDSLAGAVLLLRPGARGVAETPFPA